MEENKGKVIKIGKVLSIVESRIVVEAIDSMPPLDLDSLLFKMDGSTVGPIDDVFGPVRAPHYSIKFNDIEEINSKQIAIDDSIYFMPQAMDKSITKFAFVDKLIKQFKGTDASWEDDVEAPPEVTEYSDDEEERIARKLRKHELNKQRTDIAKAKQTNDTSHDDIPGKTVKMTAPNDDKSCQAFPEDEMDDVSSQETDDESDVCQNKSGNTCIS